MVIVEGKTEEIRREGELEIQEILINYLQILKFPRTYIYSYKYNFNFQEPHDWSAFER